MSDYFTDPARVTERSGVVRVAFLDRSRKDLGPPSPTNRFRTKPQSLYNRRRKLHENIPTPLEKGNTILAGDAKQKYGESSAVSVSERKTKWTHVVRTTATNFRN
jgi:hypothetical protein